MTSQERLLIAEDDPPLRLVGLALGAPLDGRMQTALARFFTDDVETSLTRLQGLAREAGLAGEVLPALALDGGLESHEDCRNIDLAAAARRGIPVATLKRWANTSVAEHTLLLLLAVSRRLRPAHDAAVPPAPEDVERRESFYNWGRLDSVPAVRGTTLGIVGLGEIGREVARLVAPLRMRVLYTQRQRLEPALEHELRAEFRPLDALLAEADVVSLHVPLTPDTRYLIGAQQLKLMRPGAILVNTSRGGLVDDVALIAALRDGHLGGAGLDVLPTEPPVDMAPLAELPNVVLTPHVAAGTGPELLQDVREVLANVARVRRGEPAAGLVTSVPA